MLGIKEELYMIWLFILALIPLSRILFYIVLFIVHRKENIVGEIGRNVADAMLGKVGLQDEVKVIVADDEDSYDPATNIVCLSKKNNRKTIASVAIAIHEVGHALQMNSKWMLYRFRCKIIVMKGPLIYITAILAVLGFGIRICGMLAVVSLICLLVCTVVEVVVEIDASIKGCRNYQKHFKTNSIEMRKIRFFLGVAALTYFADIINCIYMVVRFVIHMLNNGVEKKNEKRRNGWELYKM